MRLGTLLYSFSALLLVADAKGGQLPGQSPQNSIVAPPPGVSHDQFANGVREALLNGVQVAVRELGHENGFLTNVNVRIPMPKQLQAMEHTLRLMKQDRLADELVATMNHAAERAVPEALPVFAEAMDRMSLTDAENLVLGPPDAATQFFRRVTQTNLFQRFLPIVKRCTEQTGVTSSYKRIELAASANKYIGPLVGAIADRNSLDLDAYITQKTLDGLFLEIATEERRIRADPIARTTELLRKVFGGSH